MKKALQYVSRAGSAILRAFPALLVLAFLGPTPLSSAAHRVLVRSTDGNAVAVVTERGNLGLAGELHTSVSPMPTPSAGAEWVLRDSSGNVKALVKRDGEDEGDMYLAGTLSENQTSIPEQTPVPIFVSRDAEGNIVAKIDTSGNLTLAKECTDQTRQAIAVANGDFEDWTQALPSHWTCSAGALTKESGGPFHFDGSNFARIVDGGGEGGVLRHDGDATTHLDPSSTYRVTFAVRVVGWAAGDAPEVQVKLLGADDTVRRTVVEMADSAPPSGWHRFSREFNVVRQLYMVCRSNGATLDVDGVQLEEIPHAEIIAPGSQYWNVGFESGDDAWSDDQVGGYEFVSGGIMPTLYATENPLTHTTEAQDTYRGFYAIKFNDKGDEIASSSPWNNLNPSRTYRLTFHYKILCPSGYSANDTLVLGYETASAQTVSTSIQAASWTSNEWRSCDLTFTGEGEISPFARYDDTAGNGGTIFLVDELELREIDTVGFPFGVVCESDYGLLSMDLPDGVYTETGPSILLGNWRHLYIATNWSTSLWLPMAANYIDAATNYAFGANDYARSAESKVLEAYLANNNTFDTDAVVNQLGAPWRKNYCGVFTALKVENGGTAKVLGICHGENKNERTTVEGGTLYRNTLTRSSIVYNAPADYSGYLEDGTYQDYWPGYHALISLRTSDYVSQTNWGTLFNVPGYTTDAGPIVWPSGAFLHPSGTHKCCGQGSPSALLSGDYIYLVFSDESDGWSEVGRGPGVKMARAPKSGEGAPGTWKYLYRGQFTEDALPSNFDRDDPSFYRAEGGRSDTLHPELNWEVWRFNIAKLSGYPGYIGVETTVAGWEDEPEGMMCALRYSPNLLDWSPRVWLRKSYSSTYAGVRFYGVSLLSADGNSSSEVDPEGFWVTGAYEGDKFGRLWVSLHE